MNSETPSDLELGEEGSSLRCFPQPLLSWGAPSRGPAIPIAGYVPVFNRFDRRCPKLHGHVHLSGTDASCEYL